MHIIDSFTYLHPRVTHNRKKNIVTKSNKVDQDQQHQAMEANTMVIKAALPITSEIHQSSPPDVSDNQQRTSTKQ